MFAFRFTVSLFAAWAISNAPPEPPLERTIDAGISSKLKAEGITPAPQADDYTLIRRLTLDLVGRIPTAIETDAYVASKNPQKRAELVDRLMASPAFARYQATLFETMLTDKPAGGLREYLAKSIQANKHWDRIFRELMLPDELEANVKGSNEFLKPRLNDADRLTNDVSVAFFGVNVSCAQCHDHPHVKDWTQDHFFGMKAFLSRTYDAGGFIAEREAGLVKFKPTKGPERQAKLMFLTNAVVPTDTLRELTKDEQKKEKEQNEKAKAEKKPLARPAFSARKQLVDIALQPKESAYFSKAIVNRLWHRFFGLGLVNPLDQMHAENAPSHPDLLTALADDTAKHYYDLRRLTRALVMSQAYSRSSKYEGDNVPASNTFAVAQIRALTPMQLATSLKIATQDPKSFENLKPEDFEKRIEQFEIAARGFAGSIAQPTDNFQIGVSEALLFSNGERVMKEYLADANGTLLGRANAEKETVVVSKLLIRTALARPATDPELSALSAYAAKRTDRLPEAYKQMLWALLTGPEFRFNHCDFRAATARERQIFGERPA